MNKHVHADRHAALMDGRETPSSWEKLFLCAYETLLWVELGHPVYVLTDCGPAACEFEQELVRQIGLKETHYGLPHNFSVCGVSIRVLLGEEAWTVLMDLPDNHRPLGLVDARERKWPLPELGC